MKPACNKCNLKEWCYHHNGVAQYEMIPDPINIDCEYYPELNSILDVFRIMRGVK